MSHSIGDDVTLSVEQEAEAQRIYQRLEGVFHKELLGMARLLASKGNSELFGKTEHQLRDRVHRLGAETLQAAADERQKKGRVRRC